ncbi:hypothetical protein [Streptomyces sp. Wh19]|uniref:Uncharacterized protein n=1 Tax=Streptomyces sanglieri TaxID=193460 RepID=A0ABW2XCI3_9ACTN
MQTATVLQIGSEAETKPEGRLCGAFGVGGGDQILTFGIEPCQCLLPVCEQGSDGCAASLEVCVGGFSGAYVVAGETGAGLVVAAPGGTRAFALSGGLFVGVLVEQVVHLPPAPDGATFDQVGGGQVSQQLLGGHLGLFGQESGRGGGDVGAGAEGQEPEQFGLQRGQALKRLVEGGA